MQDNKTKDFLQKIKISGNWNDNYDYSKVQFNSVKSKVLVIDKKFNTEHLIQAYALLNGIKCCAKNLVDGYYSFIKCREYIHRLEFKSQGEFKKWSINHRPHFIPGSPNTIYRNDGWIGWADFLGTKKDFDGEFLSFEEARKVIQPLGLKSQKEWRQYCKSGNKPYNIPAAPWNFYKKDGWKGLNDFIGYGICPIGREYIPYEEAEKITRIANLKHNREWRKWLKKNKIEGYPAAPDRVYNGNGWSDWATFLGSKSKYGKKNLSYTESKKYFSDLNIKITSPKDWLEFYERENPPIPRDPERFYRKKKQYSGNDFWNDWIDLSKFKSKRKTVIPFENALFKIRSCNITGGWNGYKKWFKEFFPNDLPLNPNVVYKDKGWEDIYHWLGEDKLSNYNRTFLSYEEIKCCVHKFKFRYESEWIAFTKTDDFPNNFPVGPETYYKDGFKGWADFLGYIGDGKHKWTKASLIHFIKSLENELISLESVELITIINSNNLAKKINALGSLEEFVSSEAGSEDRINTLRHILGVIENEEVEDNIIENEETELSNILIEGNELGVVEPVELVPHNPIAELHMYDNTMITASLDDENIEFLMKNQLNKLWNNIINKENGLTPESFSKETGGDNFTIIKNWFFSEYNKIIKLELPKDYNFRNNKDELIQPNLMQRLTMHRLINEKSYGNWSGTGAGKTLSAILAGRVAGVKNTLIICNNATVEGWVNSINEYFINNKIYVKGQLEDAPKNSYSVFKKHNIKLNNNDNNYLVINYETFQQDDGEYIVSELLKNNIIDYIVLDEVQNVKQRENEAVEQSRRRDTVNKLVIAAREQNKELLVLAMSATPVINNLVEPKKLIELLTSESHNELDTRENIINGVEMYKALTRYGLRYRPKNGIRINEEKIEIDGSELADILVKIPKGGIVEFEKALLEAKLNGIKDKIKKGCLIYTYYVTDIIYVIGDYVKELGLSVGYYTGDDKTGLKAFKNGKVDVLIGSAPISTGVDGIQKVCNTLIPIVLPWTSAEYGQLLGRVDRQGSNFDHVNIYIPQVVIQTNNGEWSWDKRRYNIIKFKATLADLAVDGRVPKNLLPPRTKLLEDAKNELRTWVNRLNNDEIITFEREALKIPLNPTYIKRMRNELGEISQMHKEWTTRRSENVNKIFQDNPEKWFYYHTLRREKIKSWPEDPLLTIAARLKTRPDWVVADFGCGENRLKTEITNKIHAFDHVAIDESVIACDVSNVPLDDASVDVVVCCLSLWGPNWEDQIKEANRILKPFGRIFIAEKSSRWIDKENELKQKVEDLGFQCFDAIRNTGKFIYLNGEK